MSNFKKNEFLTIDRFDKNNFRTFGAMYQEGELIGYTIEDPERERKIKGETAIWKGVYPLGFRQSPRFSKLFLWSDTAKKLIFNPTTNAKNFRESRVSRETYPKFNDWREHDLIWVKDVEGFQFILLHWGNFVTDTEGCLIVGRSIGVVGNRPAVLYSQAHYLDIYPEIYLGVLEGNKKIEIV